MTTLGTMVDQLIRKGGAGVKVPNASITALTTTSFTAPLFFANGQYSNSSFVGWRILRPTTATPSDIIRQVASITPPTGLVTIDGANYADTTLTNEDFYLLPPWYRPQYLADAANFALEKLYSANIEPVSTKPISTGLSDAGFQSSSTALYTASSTTFSKHTTANSERVLQGLGSGRTLNQGYIMQQFAVTPGEPVNAFAAPSVAVGSASLVLRDATNSVAIGTTIASTYRDFQWIVRQETIPANCLLLEPRFTVVGTSDDVYWGGQCILFPNRSRAYLDTKWDGEFKATRLVSARLGGATPTSGVYPANSGDWETIPQTDYSLTFERAGPNPVVINWHNNAQRHWYQKPVLIEGRRPYADVIAAALTLSSWATDIPGIDKDLWDAATRLELFSMDDVLSSHADAGRKLARANFDFQNTASQFRKSGPSRGRSFGNFGWAPN